VPEEDGGQWTAAAAGKSWRLRRGPFIVELIQFYNRD
jgi:hypothetical protein